MAKTPRYQGGERFNPVVETGDSAAWGTLADRMSQWSDAAFQVGAERAKEMGAAEGAAAGAKPGKPDVPEDPWTIREKAYRDAALLAHKARIRTDIRDNVERIKAENAFDPEGLKASLDGYREGVLKETHQDIRPDVELLFNDYGSRAIKDVNIALVEREFQNDVGTIKNEVADLAQEALSYARDGDEEGLTKTEARLQGLLDQAVKSSLMLPAEAEKRKASIADAVVEESVIGKFEDTLYGEGLDEAEKAYLRFREADTQKLGLETRQRDRIVARMQAAMSSERARLNRGAAEAKAKKTAIEKQITGDVKDMVYLLDHGRLNERSRKEYDTLLKLAEGTKYEETLKDAMSEYDSVDRFNKLTMTEQEAFLTEAKAKGMDTGDDARLYGRLERVHRDRLTRLKNGQGLDMYYEDGYSDPPDPLDMTDEQALREGLARRNQDAETAEQVYQYDVSPLMPAEVSSINQFMEKAPADDKIRVLGIMADELGGNFLKAMEQIDKNGGSGLAVAGALYNTTGPEAARLMLVGQEVIANKASALPSGSDKAVMDQAIAEALRPFPSPKHRGAVADAIRGVYAGLSFSDGDTEGRYDSARMERAVQLVTGGVFKWEGSNWGAPESYITPPVIGWDLDRTERWLEEDLEPDDVERLGGVAGFSPSAFLGALREYGQLVPAGMETDTSVGAVTKYWVLFNGSPVKKPDGSLFELRYLGDK